jgi:ketosteroid isomerase-like protein
VVQGYYLALGDAAAGGDLAAVLDLFADDATVTLTALSPEPVSGKEAMQSVFAGLFSMLQGVTFTVEGMAVEGDQVTVDYTMTVASMPVPIPAADTFVVVDGKIQSLVLEISPEAMAGAPATAAGDDPAALPETGGAGLGSLPGLLILAGGAMAAASRRLSR